MVVAVCRRRAGHRRQLLSLSAVSTVCFQLFIDELSRIYADDFLLLVMDQAGSHRSQTMVWPEHIKPLLLPPYSPELNPVPLV